LQVRSRGSTVIRIPALPSASEDERMVSNELQKLLQTEGGTESFNRMMSEVTTHLERNGSESSNLTP
jgi:hypothetical protein